MDKGAQFVIENFEKAKELTKNAEYKNLKKKVEYEFNLIKGLKRTGDAYEYFLKYSNYSHQYADDFRFLDDYGLVSNEKMSEYLLKHYPDEIENKTTIDDFKVCETYTNSEIYLFFRGFRSGIRYNYIMIIGMVIFSIIQEKVKTEIKE